MSVSFERHDSLIEEFHYPCKEKTGFFTLPAELRTAIYDLVFLDTRPVALTRSSNVPYELCETYNASDHLQPLLTCRQFHDDAHLLAFSRTTFVVRNPYIAADIAERLTSRLRPEQVQSLRHIAIVAEARHFRQMRQWKSCAFGLSALRLDDITIVLHRSSYCHYLSDFNAMMAVLLRELQGVQRITYVRNQAPVKPHFHTWFNRFTHQILKTDHQQRFLTFEPSPENVWWSWDFDGSTQSASLTALPAKDPSMTITEYQTVITPLYEALQKSIESEEYDNDPMSRNGFV